MKLRELGCSDLQLSTIGFGSWAAGGPDWKAGWGPQDDNDSIGAIHRALELGVNWIDTAAVYGLGHSEVVVGKALKGLKQRPIIATKCGRVQDTNNNLTGNLKRESILKECDASLKRLGIDCIDLYQLHWPEPDADVEEAWGTMSELVRAGKARWLGVSNFNVSQMKRAQKIHPIASSQPPYSMLRREIEAEVLPYCAAQNIGSVVYSPMQAGLLSGTFTRERLATLAPNDWRRNNARFQEPQISQILAKVDELKKIAARLNMPMTQLALGWVLRNPEVTSAIVGVRSPTQIEETAPAGDVTIPADALAEIDKILNTAR